MAKPIDMSELARLVARYLKPDTAV
jgi:hypothetical protein